MNSQSVNDAPSTFRPKTYGLAVISLVLAILGLLPVLPLIGSIIGIVTGNIARKEIIANRDRYTGEAYAKAGIILGWIGVALFVLVVVGLVLFLMPVNRTISTGPTFQVTGQP